MAARLTDKQKKKIVADYLESQSVNAAAKKNGVSWDSAKKALEEAGEIEKKLEDKKLENTADILAYMEEQKQAVCDIIGVGLEVLPEKIRQAKTASEVTTALGTLIDKFTRQLPAQKIEVENSMSLSEKMEAIREAAERYGR